MGCECCKEINPEDYAKCKVVNKIPYKNIYFAPCGMDFNKSNYSDSNYTPPKKKRKRKK